MGGILDLSAFSALVEEGLACDKDVDPENRLLSDLMADSLALLELAVLISEKTSWDLFGHVDLRTDPSVRELYSSYVVSVGVQGLSEQNGRHSVE